LFHARGRKKERKKDRSASGRGIRHSEEERGQIEWERFVGLAKEKKKKKRGKRL